MEGVLNQGHQIEKSTPSGLKTNTKLYLFSRSTVQLRSSFSENVDAKNMSSFKRLDKFMKEKSNKEH